MTNTHHKITTRTTARIAAGAAIGIGAAIAFPALAAAQDTTAPTSPEKLLLEPRSMPLESASLESLPLDAASLQAAIGTDLNVDLGSLNFSLVLDAETPNPGSVELGSVGISPNTGSAIVDGDAGSVSDSVSESAAGPISDSVSDIVPDFTESGTIDTASLAGLSSGADDGAAADETPATGSLG